MDNPKNYRPISLLCVPFKFLEWLLARLEPVVNPQLSKEQARIWRGCSIVHQIVKLTSNIEESFEKSHKAGVILEDLTSAYNTIWLQELMLKLLRHIPDWHLVQFITSILSNHWFVLKTTDEQSSRPRQFINGVPQGSVRLPCYSICKSVTFLIQHQDSTDMLITSLCFTLEKLGSYVEDVLTADSAQLAQYLQTWRLKLSMAKTTSPQHQGVPPSTRSQPEWDTSTA